MGKYYDGRHDVSAGLHSLKLQFGRPGRPLLAWNRLALCLARAEKEDASPRRSLTLLGAHNNAKREGSRH